MGHDILGYNKDGEQIAYARFSMGNYHALTLYSVLNALQFYGGVSGLGKVSSFSKEQIQEALKKYEAQYGEPEKLIHSETHHWDIKQIAQFLLNCSKTAEKEGSVEIFFG